MRYVLLITLAILPVAILMVIIYRQDKFQKEPVKSLIKAFIGGILAILVDTLFCIGIEELFSKTEFSKSMFFDNFMLAGIPEELSKFLIFMIFIWRDKNFDEYMDGIVYSVFISLGFACIENIAYVLEFGIGAAIMRALLSVPGHFLDGVMLGYFLSMAKFRRDRRLFYILSGLLLTMLSHGLFDWLLSATSIIYRYSHPFDAYFLYALFIAGNIFLWKLGVNFIRKQQENSKLQTQEIAPTDTDALANQTEQDTVPENTTENEPL